MNAKHSQALSMTVDEREGSGAASRGTESTMDFYMPEQVAKILGKTEGTLANWCSHKPLPKGPPFTKLGHTILYRVDLFNAWLEANTVYTKVA